MLKAIKSKNKNENKKMVNVRVTEDEAEQMQKLADKYTGGNLTAWVKYTALNYVPKKYELTK